MTEPKAPKATLPRTIVETVPTSAKMAKAIDQLDQLLVSVFAEADIATLNGAIGAARAFVVLHRLNEKLDTFCKAFGAKYDNYKTVLIPEALEAAKVTHIPLSEGFRVGVSYRLYASIKEGQKDQAYHWLRANKLGDLISSTINASTLSGAFKHMIEEDNRDPPDDVFNVLNQPNTSVTATKTK